MPNANPLADLRDIHLPHPVSAWPPGPGYYALIALLIVFVLILIKHLQYRKKLAPKREALNELERLETEYNQTHAIQSTTEAIATLLKRVALVYHPRAQVAGLHGEDWIAFLEQTSKQIDFKSVQADLLDAPFHPDSEEKNHTLTPLFIATRRWIKQRRGKCLN